jgi:hypothetical protein
MVGPADPLWQGFTTQGDPVPVNRRTVSAPMFGAIGDFKADESTFSNTIGAQYNYTITGQQVPGAFVPFSHGMFKI